MIKKLKKYKVDDFEVRREKAFLVLYKNGFRRSDVDMVVRFDIKKSKNPSIMVFTIIEITNNAVSVYCADSKEEVYIKKFVENLMKK